MYLGACSLKTMWMELEGIMLSEIRERQISYDFTHMRTSRHRTDDHKGRKAKKYKNREGTKHKAFFLNMKFIVKLVSIQHPVLIPTGALLNAHHPLSPPSHPSSSLSLFSVFKILLWFASFPLCNFFFPLLLPDRKSVV